MRNSAVFCSYVVKCPCTTPRAVSCSHFMHLVLDPEYATAEQRVIIDFSLYKLLRHGGVCEG